MFDLNYKFELVGASLLALAKSIYYQVDSAIHLSSNWSLIYFFTHFIIQFPVSDPCSHHVQLNDRTRAAGVHRGNVLKCDQKDMPDTKWYRFIGSSGTMMPTSCVPKHYCGTHAPGWLNGAHPTRLGQIVNGQVCFHWGGSCCNWKANIQIKKCNGFYVYKLGKTPVCWLRYCGNAGFGEL